MVNSENKRKEYSMKNKPVFFLGGGGSASKSFNLDALFFASLPADSTILYVPVALPNDRYAGAIDWITGAVREHSKTIQIEMMTEENVIDVDFSKYSAIYIGGGNTYKLLNFVMVNNLKPKLLEYVKSGGKIYGGSAGAALLGKSIDTTFAMDEVKDYKYNDGLDFLNGFSVTCHWPECNQYIKNFVIRNNASVYCLPEVCGLVLDLDGNVIEQIGEGFEVLK